MGASRAANLQRRATPVAAESCDLCRLLSLVHVSFPNSWIYITVEVILTTGYNDLSSSKPMTV